MSLLIVRLAPQKVEVVTDTLGYLADFAPWNLTTKLFTLPHARILIADRGSTHMARAFLFWILDAVLPAGMDDLVDRAPDALGRLYLEYLDEHGDRLAGSPDGHAAKSEMNVIGWSSSQRRFIGRAFCSDADFEPVEIQDDLSTTPEPSTDMANPVVAAVARRWGAAIQTFRSPETFIALAELQKAGLEAALGGGAGGELVLTEMYPQVIQSRTIHRFADYAAALAAMNGAAPAAEPQPETEHAA